MDRKRFVKLCMGRFGLSRNQANSLAMRVIRKLKGAPK